MALFSPSSHLSTLSPSSHHTNHFSFRPFSSLRTRHPSSSSFFTIRATADNGAEISGASAAVAVETPSNRKIRSRPRLHSKSRIASPEPMGRWRLLKKSRWLANLKTLNGLVGLGIWISSRKMEVLIGMLLLMPVKPSFFGSEKWKIKLFFTLYSLLILLLIA